MEEARKNVLHSRRVTHEHVLMHKVGRGGACANKTCAYTCMYVVLSMQYTSIYMPAINFLTVPKS